MSAYSASPPVTASTTTPRIITDSMPCSMKKRMPHIGLSAATTAGAFTML